MHFIGADSPNLVPQLRLLILDANSRSHSMNYLNWPMLGAALLTLVSPTAEVLAEQPQLEEIVVTAERRTQNPQDVATALQVFTGRVLEQRGADGFDDYVLSVPGLSFRDQGAGATRIAIRGVSNVAASDFGITSPVSTVGLYLNDVPIQGTSQLPNLTLYDLEQIEVLKGPQGTLYGEGAMGGAIRMTLAGPDPTAFSARGELVGSFTGEGGLNNAVRAALNIPLVRERTALRLVGTYRDDEGFIDNIARDEKKANSSSDFSVRALLSTSFSDRVEMEVMSLVSSVEDDDFPTIDSGLGDLEMDSSERRFRSDDVRLYGLTVNADLGFANLTSVTSQTELDREFLDRFLLSSVFFADFGAVTGDPIYTATEQESFAQEIRLVSPGDETFDWILGAFYRDKEQDGYAGSYVMPSDLPAINKTLSTRNLPTVPNSKLLPPAFGDIGILRSTNRYEQVALYAEGDYEFKDRWNFTFGARWFDEQVTVQDGLIFFSIAAGASSPYRQEDASSSDVLLKARLSYQASDDALLYFTVAEGFRSGGINLTSLLQVGDLLFESDELVSFELGAKTTWCNGRLVLNGSVYFQHWADVQSNGTDISPVTRMPTNFIGNAGDAEIMGLEAELNAQASEALSIGLTLGYAGSELTSAIADAVVGADLPNVPEFTTSAHIDYAFDFFGLRGGFARFDIEYTDDQFTRVQRVGDPTGFPVDSYMVGHFRLGYSTDAGLSGHLFIDNLWDERARIGRGRTGTSAFNSPGRFVVNRPRTYGLVLKFDL